MKKRKKKILISILLMFITFILILLIKLSYTNNKLNNYLEYANTQISEKDYKGAKNTLAKFLSDFKNDVKFLSLFESRNTIIKDFASKYDNINNKIENHELYVNKKNIKNWIRLGNKAINKQHFYNSYADENKTAAMTCTIGWYVITYNSIYSFDMARCTLTKIADIKNDSIKIIK